MTMALEVGQLYALFSIDTSGVNTALTGISTHLTSLGREFTRAGLLWTSAITKPLVNAGKDVIQTGMDYHEAMARVAATAGIDTESAAMTALEKKSLQVASTSIYTSEQVAEAYNYMALAGWKTESMLGAIETVMNVAAASGEDVARISDIITDDMTAFGYTFESVGGDVDVFQGMVEHFGDVLAATATNSNTTIGMMGEAFKYVGSYAGQLGYSIDDVAIAMGLMANRGVKASIAGTSLRRILSNLIKPTDEMQSAMTDLGISMYDEDGRMLDFMELMVQLRGAFADLPEEGEFGLENLANRLDEFNALDAVQAYQTAMEQLDDEIVKNGGNVEDYMDADIVSDYSEACEELSKDISDMLDNAENGPEAFRRLQYAATIAGTRGLPGLLAIIGASDEEFSSLTDAIYNSKGAAETMKNTALDSLAGDLVIFKSAVDVLKISIEELVDDKLRSLLQSATELINKFIGMDDESKETILNMAGIAAAIGPALVGFGAIMKILPALGSAFHFLASPMGLIVGLLGALALNALNSEGQISNALNDVAEVFGFEGIDLSDFSISDLLDDLLGSISDLSEDPAIQGFMEKLGEGLIGAMGFIGDVIGELIGYLLSPEGLRSIAEAGLAIGKLLLKAVSAALEGFVNLVDNLVLGILDGLGLIDKAAKAEEETLASVLTDWVKASALDSEKAAEHAGRDMLTALLLGIGSGDSGSSLALVESMGIRSLYDALQEELLKPGSEKLSVKELILSALAKQNNDSGQYDKLTEWIDSLTDEVWEDIEKGIDGNMNFGEGRDLLKRIMNEWFSDQVQHDVDGDEVDQMIADALSETGAENTKSVMKDAFEEVPKSALDAMETTMTDEKSSVATAAAEISDAAVQSFLLTMSAQNAAIIANTYIGGMINGLAESVSPLTEASTVSAQTIVTVFSEILSPDVGWSIGAAFANSIASAIGGVTYQLQGVIWRLTSQISAVRQAAAGASSVLTYSPYGPSNRGGVYGSNNTQGVTAAEIAGAVKGAVSGMTVEMDGVTVGRVITPVVSRNIADEINYRG